MLNQAVLVGRIAKIEETEKGTNIVMAIPRSYKDTNGEYPTDMIKVRLLGNIARSTLDYCRKGDLIGVKGSLQSGRKGTIILNAEKVTFLSSRSQDGGDSVTVDDED